MSAVNEPKGEETGAGSRKAGGGTDCCGVAAGVFGIVAVLTALAPALVFRHRRSTGRP